MLKFDEIEYTFNDIQMFFYSAKINDIMIWNRSKSTIIFNSWAKDITEDETTILNESELVEFLKEWEYELIGAV